VKLIKMITVLFHRIDILAVQEIADAAALNKVNIRDFMTFVGYMDIIGL